MHRGVILPKSTENQRAECTSTKELFEQLLAIAPRDYQAHLFLGHLYKRTGRIEDATARFDAFSRGQRAHRLEKTAQREFESKVEEIFGG